MKEKYVDSGLEKKRGDELQKLDQSMKEESSFRVLFVCPLVSALFFGSLVNICYGFINRISAVVYFSLKLL